MYSSRERSEEKGQLVLGLEFSVPETNHTSGDEGIQANNSIPRPHIMATKLVTKTDAVMN